MPAKIRFIQLDLINFANLQELTMSYGDHTKLSGKNGEGKTTIGTAPAWIIGGYGLDGKEFDPRPTTYEYDRVFASLIISVDGDEVVLAREIDEKGANKFYINGNKKAATAYKDYIATLFTKEHFLSLYSPSFFFTQHKFTQREQVMKHVTPPLNKEIFEEMSRLNPKQKSKEIVLNPQALRLSEELKKRTIEELKTNHTDLKNKHEKLHIQSQGSVKTLSDQSKALADVANIDLEIAASDIAAIDQSIEKANKVIQESKSINLIYEKAEKALSNLQARIQTNKDKWPSLKGEQIVEKCASCEREYDERSRQVATANLNARDYEFQQAHKDLMAERDKAKAALIELEKIDLVEKFDEINQLQRSKDPYHEKIRIQKQKDAIAGQLSAAKKLEEEHLKAKNDSIFVLDAIKAFNAKEAELQVGKVQALFTTLSVRLFEYVKSKDAWIPDFSIQMNGKDYSSLSAGEKIGAGLELVEVLFKQSELIVPCFIDGIESYTGPVAVYDQLITGRAVPDQELKIA